MAPKRPRMRSAGEDEELVGNGFSSSIVKIHKEGNGEILRLPRLMTATVVKERPDQPVGLILKLKRLTSPPEANDKKPERHKQQLSTSHRDRGSTVVVSELLPDSPFSSTLRPCDEILTINGHRVRDPRRAAQMIKHAEGRLSVTVSRGGRIDGTIFGLAKLDDSLLRNNSDDSAWDDDDDEFARQMGQMQLSNQMPLQRAPACAKNKWGIGLVRNSAYTKVSRLSSSGPFSKCGVRVGDILLSIDGQSVSSPEEAMDRLTYGSRATRRRTSSSASEMAASTSTSSRNHRVVALLVYSPWHDRERIVEKVLLSNPEQTWDVTWSYRDNRADLGDGEYVVLGLAKTTVSFKLEFDEQDGSCDCWEPLSSLGQSRAHGPLHISGDDDRSTSSGSRLSWDEERATLDLIYQQRIQPVIDSLNHYISKRMISVRAMMRNGARGSMEEDISDSQLDISARSLSTESSVSDSDSSGEDRNITPPRRQMPSRALSRKNLQDSARNIVRPKGGLARRPSMKIEVFTSRPDTSENLRMSSLRLSALAALAEDDSSMSGTSSTSGGSSSSSSSSSDSSSSSEEGMPQTPLQNRRRPIDRSRQPPKRPVERHGVNTSETTSKCKADRNKLKIRNIDIRERYKVLTTVLGRGAFGTVRVCVDRQSLGLFCVKSVLKRGNIRNLTLLQNEIALLQQIRHRHIVSVIECIQDYDYVHIVMQKCDGGDMFEKIIEQNIRLEESRVCEIMCCVMDAISYVQEMDIVHRDLKAEHLMLCEDSLNCRVVIIDWGLATIHSNDDPPMTAFAGSAFSVAPEVIKRSYGKMCDLWSCGVITFFLLTRGVPFNAPTDKQIFEKILSGQFGYPQWAKNGISDEAKDFIDKLLVVNPKNRMTAKQALAHSWIRKYSGSHSKHNVDRSETKTAPSLALHSAHQRPRKLEP